MKIGRVQPTRQPPSARCGPSGSPGGHPHDDCCSWFHPDGCRRVEWTRSGRLSHWLVPCLNLKKHPRPQRRSLSLRLTPLLNRLPEMEEAAAPTPPVPARAPTPGTEAVRTNSKEARVEAGAGTNGDAAGVVVGAVAADKGKAPTIAAVRPKPS